MKANVLRGEEKRRASAHARLGLLNATQLGDKRSLDLRWIYSDNLRGRAWCVEFEVSYTLLPQARVGTSNSKPR